MTTEEDYRDYEVHPPIQFEDLIYFNHDTLSEEFCEHLIQKFDNDDRREEGKIGGPPGTGARIIKDIKQSTDLNISNCTDVGDWQEEDQILFKSLNDNLKRYIDYLPKCYSGYIRNLSRDTGYQIQRTEPGGFYTWHNDSNDQCRMVTFLWYLNTIKEDGYTEFCNGLKVYPERGKLMIFPATWTYVHRGYPPKNEVKYICTGWTHFT